MFKRGQFYGDFRNTEPKWHVLREIKRPASDEVDSKWGTHIAWCGYSRSNLLGDLTISKAKKPKKVDETCGSCLVAIAKADKNRGK